MNLGAARLVIVIALVVTGIAVLSNAFGAGTSALTPLDGGGSPTPSGSSTTPPPPSHSPKPLPSPETTGVRVSVFNGIAAPGCAGKVNALLVGDGYVAADPPADVTSGVPWGRSAVYYRPDPQHQDQSDATYLSTHYFNGVRVAKLPASFPGAVSPTAQAVVLIGNDYRTSC